MKQTIFCIVGMHRSGSSLFANWLYKSGVFIGDNLYGAASSNKKGHFEDLAFLDLHKEDLQKKGYDISGLFVDKNSIIFEDKNIAKAKELIENRKIHSIWGWKEPRTTLYLDSWKKIIPNLKIIVLVRDQEKVVESLYKRLKKNKWYYTRNPFKKILWWLDIDLKPKKWKLKFALAFNIYYSACESFKSKYPNDTFIVDTNNFIKNTEEVSKQLNIFLESNIEFADLKSIYESKLLSK